MLLDIVILPPNNLRQAIGKKVRRAIKGEAVDYVIDNVKLIPHLSLFHIRTSKKKLNTLGSIIEEIRKKYPTTTVRSLVFEKFTEYGFSYVWFRLSNNQKLKKLNKEIIERCYPLRTGEMPWTSKKQPSVLDKKLRSKYGTQHNIGKRFVPHFTIAKLKNKESAEKVERKLKTFKFKFLADTIAICEVNKYHQVIRIIRKFKLKK